MKKPNFAIRNFPSDFRLVLAYVGGNHAVYHVAGQQWGMTGRHIKITDTGQLFDDENCWNSQGNPCPAVQKLNTEI